MRKVKKKKNQLTCADAVFLHVEGCNLGFEQESYLTANMSRDQLKEDPGNMRLTVTNYVEK